MICLNLSFDYNFQIYCKPCFYWYILVEIDENKKRQDFLSWDEYFMSAAFLTAMRSKVRNLTIIIAKKIKI